MRARITIALLTGLAAGLCACLVLASCGGDSNLDTAGLESQMKKTLSDRTGIPIASVDCPDEVEPKRGRSFGCTATTERGERVVLRVTQEDDEGAVRWRVVRGPR
jgi:hypothetical protein